MDLLLGFKVTGQGLMMRTSDTLEVEAEIKVVEGRFKFFLDGRR